MSCLPTIRFAALISLAVWLAPASASFAATATLRPVADASLFSLNGGSNNLGGSTTLIVGTTAGESTSRAVLRFDVAGNLPPEAIVTSVRLNLIVTKANDLGVASTFEVRRLRVPWGEGNKTGNTGQPATDGEVTWNHRFFPREPWSAHGAAAPVDFSADPAASTEVGAPGTYAFGTTSNLVEDVQNWLTNSAANYGWIVLSQSEGTALTARRLGSREDNVNSPTLVIDFIPPPAIAGASTDGALCSFHFTVESGFNYTVEYAETFPVTSWLELTNFSGKLGEFEAGVTNSVLASPKRFFRVGRVPCNCR